MELVERYVFFSPAGLFNLLWCWMIAANFQNREIDGPHEPLVLFPALPTAVRCSMWGAVADPFPNRTCSAEQYWLYGCLRPV